MGVILYVSCRKTDTNVEPNPDVNLYNKFFNSHIPTDPLVIQIAELLKRENFRHNLVQKISSKIGFPYWDKAMTINSDVQNRDGDESDEAITMIPFVRDSQNYVNSILLFKTSSRDSSYQFLCDWQYASYGFDTSQTKWDASNIFHIFTEFEKSVFNHTKFIITDTRIIGDTSETVMILLDSTNVLSGRPSILTPITVCTPYTICGQCLAFRTASMAGPEFCCFPREATFCSTFWIEDGWTPVGGGTGGGEPGGGGSDGGAYTPPNCGGEGGRPNVYEPCTSGWYPIPIPGDDLPSPDPTDSILARYSRAIKDTAVYIYDNLSQPNNIEHALTGWLDNNVVKIYDVRTINDSLNAEPNLMFGQRVNVIFIWHSHVSRSANPAQRGSFSPSDIDMLRTPRILKQGFVSFADCRNKRYALVITDVDKAQTFFANNNFEKIDSLHNIYQTGANAQIQDENSVIKVIGSYANSGIKFYVSDDPPNFQSWSLLNN